MSTRIDIEYEGNLRCRAVHEPTGSVVETDEPAGEQDRQAGFGPTDLAAASLGTCILTVMGAAARARDWDLGGIRASVEKTMADKPRRIGNLKVALHLPASLDERQRRILERSARTCPVHASLGEGTEIEISFRYE